MIKNEILFSQKMGLGDSSRSRRQAMPTYSRFLIERSEIRNLGSKRIELL